MGFRSWVLCSISALPVFAAVNASYLDELPFRFEANRGQGDPSIHFLARGRGYSLGLTTAGNVLSLGAATVSTRIVGANPQTRLEPVDLQPTSTHYLVGDDPAQWLRDVPSWSAVKYRQIYPGIDLLFYGNSHRLEYDFNVSPGADPARIQLEFSGARRIRIDAAGDLVLDTAAGEIRWRKPSVYQRHGSARAPIAGAFSLRGLNHVGFRIGPYDHSRELIIDPTLAYATFLGSAKNDAAFSVAVDNNGFVYICGYTGSTDFPVTSGTLQTAYAGGTLTGPVHGDAFVTKLDPVTGKVIYNTYLGGRGDDLAQAIAADSAGNVFVAGNTTSANFPTTANAFSRTYRGAGGSAFHASGDAFLVKLNPAGNTLLYGTYFGGTRDDAATALAIDAAGNMFIAGSSYSMDLPVTPGVVQFQFHGGGGNLAADTIGARQSYAFHTGDAFVAKFNADGTLAFATYLGGALDDVASAIALDAGGNIYVAGGTLSTDFPTTPGAFQRAYHGTSQKDQYLLITGDAFVAKLNSTGTQLIYSTYLGGARDDIALALAVDSAGAAYITGFTSSTDFPTTTGALSRTYKGPPTLSPLLSFMAGDVFITKLNAAGAQLVFSTLLGGVNDEGGTGIALDYLGNIYVSGFTNSGDFPVTADAVQKSFPGAVYVEPKDLTKVFASPKPIGHPFLLQLPPDGSKILYSTFLGGTGNDRWLTRVALDTAGNAYLAGLTGSKDFPVTPNAAQRIYGGADSASFTDPKGDAFVAMISGLFTAREPVKPPPALSITVTSVVNTASQMAGSVSPGEIVTISGTALGPAGTLVGAPDPDAGLLSTSLGGVSVRFDGNPAPLVSVSAAKVVAIVPYEIAGQSSAQLTVAFNNQVSAPAALSVVLAAPGLFTADSSGAGQTLCTNADGSPNSDANPATIGDIITLYGTGEGQTIPAGTDGLVAGDPGPQPNLPVSVTIDGQPAMVVSYGGTPGKPAGYFQVSVQVPDGTGAGDPLVVLTIGDASMQQSVTVAVKAASESETPAMRRRRQRSR